MILPRLEMVQRDSGRHRITAQSVPGPRIAPAPVDSHTGPHAFDVGAAAARPSCTYTCWPASPPNVGIRAHGAPPETSLPSDTADRKLSRKKALSQKGSLSGSRGSPVGLCRVQVRTSVPLPVLIPALEPGPAEILPLAPEKHSEQRHESAQQSRLRMHQAHLCRRCLQMGGN